MRKFLYIVLLLLPLTAAGQEKADHQSRKTQYVSSPVLRHGNTYMVADQRMHSRAYRGYLKNTCPEAYGQFERGYKTAMVGWGLFAAGPVLTGSTFVPFLGASFGYDPNHTAAQERKRQAVEYSCFGLTCLGGALCVSGIVCLGVGYGQMHHTASHRNCGTVAYLTLEKRPNEIGLALHF